MLHLQPLVSNLVVSTLKGASLGPQPCKAEAGQKEPSLGVATVRDYVSAMLGGPISQVLWKASFPLYFVCSWDLVAVSHLIKKLKDSRR